MGGIYCGEDEEDENEGEAGPLVAGEAEEDGGFGAKELGEEAKREIDDEIDLELVAGETFAVHGHVQNDCS